MKRILILIIGLIGVAQAQFAPTSSKSAFKWGVSIGTRDSTAYAANDSLVVVINRAGRMMYRSTDGYWKLLANAASSDYVPYTGAVDNVNLGTYRLTARSLKTDSIYANGSGGMYLLTNTGAAVAHWGSGGSVEVDFKGFAGYDANRSGSYTARSFTDKNYVDSADGLRLLKSDTAAMLSGYKTYYPRTAISAGTGISYNPATGVITNSSPSSGGTVTSVATNNGSGITGGTITSTGTIAADTTILSTKANVTGTLVGYTTLAQNALKVNISDTATMLSNYRRKTTLIENADLRNSAITINGSSTSLGGSISVGTVTSVAASAGTGISVTGSPITGSGTLTITNTAPDQTVTLTAGTGISVTGTYPNFTVTNTSPSSGGTVTSVSAGTGMSFTTITSSGAVNADTTTLATRAYVVGLDVGKANTSLNNVNGVLSSTYGGAGSVSGILKANGSGVVSAAVAGTDYVAPSALSGYVDLTNAQTVGGTKTFTSPINVTNQNINLSNAYYLAGKLTNGTNITLIGMNGSDKVSIDPNGYGTVLGGTLNGTSLSMSGGGSFGGNVLLGSGSASGSYRLTVNGDASSVASGAIFRANGTDVMYFGNISAANTTDWEIWNPRNGYTRFGNNNVEVGRFASDGTFLINTTTTDGTNKLIVNGGVKGGAFTGTTATFLSGSSTTEALIVGGAGGAGATRQGQLKFGDAGTVYKIQGGEDYSAINFIIGSTTVQSLSSTGAATFSSSVTATSFIVGNGQYYKATRSSGSLVTDMIGIPSGTDNVRILTTGDLNVVNGSLTNLLTISNTGAATFSSSVTATTYTGTTTTTSSTGTIADGIETVFVNNTGVTTITITLPSASGKMGRALKVVRTAGSLTSICDVTSVNGGTHSLGCLDAIDLVSDGTTWRIVAKYVSTECT